MRTEVTFALVVVVVLLGLIIASIVVFTKNRH